MLTGRILKTVKSKSKLVLVRFCSALIFPDLLWLLPLSLSLLCRFVFTYLQQVEWTSNVSSEKFKYFRSRKVNLRGLNQQGSDVQLTLSGWGARIAQHEVDHLSGQMFVDRAPIETLSFDYWNIVNSRAGEFRLNFEGIKVINLNTQKRISDKNIYFRRVLENGLPVDPF